MNMHTRGGRSIDLNRISPADVSPFDIIHALSNICRFAGHTPFFYSVAQHSCNVAKMLPRCYRAQGLLHDAAEAYIGDLIAPVKYGMGLPRYHALEDRVLDAIGKRLSVSLTPMHPLVYIADRRMTQTELCRLMNQEEAASDSTYPPYDFEIHQMTTSEVQDEFWRMFRENLP